MKNTGFFHFSLADFGRARSRTGVFRTVFYVFFEGERHDLSKTGGFGRKMPPPPGKPVTFYECHPEDHAPAPSVRADFDIYRVRRGVLFRQIPESLRAGDRRRTRRFRDPHLAAGKKHLEKDRIIR